MNQETSAPAPPKPAAGDGVRATLTEKDGPVGRQRALLAKLRPLIAERKQLEAEEEPEFLARREALVKDAKQREAQLQYDGGKGTEALAAQQQQERAAAIAKWEEIRGKLSQAAAAAVAAAEKAEKQRLAAAEEAFRDAKWQSQTVHDGRRDIAKREFDAHCEASVALRDRAKALWESSFRWLQDAGRQRLLVARSPAGLLKGEAPPPAEGPAPTHEEIAARLAEAEAALGRLKSLTMPNWAKPEILVWPFVLLGAGVGAAVYFLAMKDVLIAGGAGVAAAAVLGGLVVTALVKKATAQCDAQVQPLAEGWAAGETGRQHSLAATTAAHQTGLKEAKAVLEAEVAAAEQARAAAAAAAAEAKRAALAAAQAKYPPALAQLDEAHQAALAKMDAEHPAALKELAERKAAKRQALERERDAALAELDQRRRARWMEVGNRWIKGIGALQQEADAIAAEVRGYAPPWGDPAWEEWSNPWTAPAAGQFGDSRLDLALLPDGVPQNPKLAAAKLAADWPAVVHFPRESLFLRAAGLKLGEANEAVQAFMLRLLASIPAGKLRLTIIDPVGLGQPFASFMHLADYEDRLVHGRIWTENRQIEHALSDITSHMETVIQKYLRNEYETIEAYNAEAGEMAEPYRLVVVANYPTSFTEDAVKRLNSIVQSGARCGVVACITYDPKAPTNAEPNIADLERRCATLQWAQPKEKDKPARWTWRDPEFAPFHPTLAKPADADFTAKLVHAIGKRAKEGLRVQVPFSAVAPAEGHWWEGDTAQLISVALGRAGATKLQYLKMGIGTAQHALVAGRTGSGKSTLLHALIVNLALHYSPEEIELYLIDFKKGVEFKTYAHHHLPHARIVAVESEREFGLSVMQRLDYELKRRGEIYRLLGVQDLAGYRAARKKDPSLEPLPRVLLVVDEFQEFFVEDDKVAQEATLLLDRIVRQGRAFGVHCHMGSQTLGGSYSLPRATLGQMAIRIALQCSEADARTILAEDNAAARLLSRPGEAIYNDGNGAVEANSPFQVVYLTDEEREKYLLKLNVMARERGMMPKTPMIVFEGNAPADIDRSGIAELAEGVPQPKPLAATLGDPVAIKDATTVEFRKQTGTNLLIIGQQPELSLGIVAAALLSLAARLRGTPWPELTHKDQELPRFTLLNGLPEDGVGRPEFDALAAALPHSRSFGLRDADKAIDVAACEVERRLADPDGDHPTAFVVAFDLPRFRQLRKPEDDFSFRSDPDAPPNPAKRFLTIVRDGPAAGVHLIVWCDTLNNVNRHFDRSTLREFDLRTLFQMSQADSGTLIDSPAASRLGPNRALFMSEEQGRAEKFRPYGLPTPEWIAALGAKLQAGA